MARACLKSVTAAISLLMAAPVSVSAGPSGDGLGAPKAGAPGIVERVHEGRGGRHRDCRAHGWAGTDCHRHVYKGGYVGWVVRGCPRHACTRR